MKDYYLNMYLLFMNIKSKFCCIYYYKFLISISNNKQVSSFICILKYFSIDFHKLYNSLIKKMFILT